MFIYFSTLYTLCIYMLLLTIEMYYPLLFTMHSFHQLKAFVKPPLAHLWKNESESHLIVSHSLRPHGILQARILERVAFPFSWETCPTQGKIAGGFFTSWATREVLAQLCFLSTRTLCQFSGFSQCIFSFSGLISTCVILPFCLFFKNFRKKIQPLSSYVHICIPSLSSPYPFLPFPFLSFPSLFSPFSSSPPPIPYAFFPYFCFPMSLWFCFPVAWKFLETF